MSAAVNAGPTVTVLFFAGALTATGVHSQTVVLPNPSFKLSDLGPLLVAKHPGTDLERVLSTSRWSVDMEMIDEPGARMLSGGEEVAVIPPVSGG